MKESSAAAAHDVHGALRAPTDETLHPHAPGALARQQQLFGAHLAAR